MLRVLSLGALLSGMAAIAGPEDFEQAEARANSAAEATELALEQLESAVRTRTPDDFDQAAGRANIVPDGQFPALTDELSDPATLATIGELMDEAQSLASHLGVSEAPRHGLQVYAFASFSMPDASLRALIQQGELASVPIVLRGLVENSVEATMRRVFSLSNEGERQELGAVIDPTLFARFGVDQVPTVVVAAYTADACTADTCPTPPYVKIAGDVPLRYSLERVALARPEFRPELEALMKLLEPRREW